MVTNLWYILHDDTTGPNGRTYRVAGSVLETHVAGIGWVESYFGSFARLKAYVLRSSSRQLKVSDKEMRTRV